MIYPLKLYDQLSVGLLAAEPALPRFPELRFQGPDDDETAWLLAVPACNWHCTQSVVTDTRVTGVDKKAQLSQRDRATRCVG